MPIRFTCDCGKKHKTHDGTEGKRILCAGCGKKIYIPGLPQAPALPPLAASRPAPPPPPPPAKPQAAPVAARVVRPPSGRTKAPPHNGEVEDRDEPKDRRRPEAKPKRSRLPFFIGGGVLAALFVTGVIVAGAMILNKKGANALLGGEPMPEGVGRGSTAKIERDTLVYTPVYQSPPPAPDEELAVYVFVAPAGGRKLDEEICRAGGIITTTFGGNPPTVRRFGELYKDRTFEGFQITQDDSEGVAIRSNSTLRIDMSPPGFQSEGLSRLGKKAQASVAVGLRKKVNGDWQLVRFLTEIITVEFAPNNH